MSSEKHSSLFRFKHTNLWDVLPTSRFSPSIGVQVCEEKGEMNSASRWQRSVLSAPLVSLPPRVSRKRSLSLGCCLPCRHARLTVRICFDPTDCKQGALNQTSERGQVKTLTCSTCNLFSLSLPPSRHPLGAGRSRCPSHLSSYTTSNKKGHWFIVLREDSTRSILQTQPSMECNTNS